MSTENGKRKKVLVMVYQIYYGDSRPRKVLFDIEYYLAISDMYISEDDKWYVELHSSSFVSGAVDFLWNAFTDKDNFNFEEFKKDCYELEELRGWIWETHDNHCRSSKEAGKDKYEWGEYIRKKIYDFANKYGLYVNED